MYFEDIRLHETRETSRVRIEREQMLSFAETYDPVPLHLDEQYAKTTRYGRLIAPGVMVFMSVWARYIREIDFAGGQLVAGRSTAMEWFHPVFAGDTVWGRAEVTALVPRNPYNGSAEITIDVYNQDGVLVLRDVTDAVVLRRPAG